MSIVGDHPERGTRFDLQRAELERADGERAEGVGSGCLYEGFAFTPDTKHALRIVVDGAGVVSVDCARSVPCASSEPALPKDILDRAKMLVRTVWRHSQDDGSPLPLRIRRWRAG